MTIPQRFLTAGLVKVQVQRLLADCPELREDDEALILSLESETDATEFCARLVRKIKENEAHGNSVAAYIAELKDRIEMFERRDIGLRAILLQIMEAMGIKTLPLPVATLSARLNRHVIVIEPGLVPEKYRRHPAWEPMKKQIMTELKEGRTVPGCTLSNPEPSLQIRVK